MPAALAITILTVAVVVAVFPRLGVLELHQLPVMVAQGQLHLFLAQS
jgi:hypothetical protein